MPRFIDLTLTLRRGMRGVEFTPACTVAEHGWNATTLHLYSHCGTHMDAPCHYEVSDQGIDQIPIEACAGPAWIVDLGAIEPRGLIDVQHLGPVAGRLQPGESILFRSGWSLRLEQPEYRLALPRIAPGLARWCVDRQVRILGVEPPAVADVTQRAETTEIHRILLAGGVGIVEGLAHLDRIRDPKVWFIALPIKWERGDGAPVRALAIEGAPWADWIPDIPP